jgi:hypothetical protein
MALASKDILVNFEDGKYKTDPHSMTVIPMYYNDITVGAVHTDDSNDSTLTIPTPGRNPDWYQVIVDPFVPAPVASIGGSRKNRRTKQRRQTKR